MLRALAPRSYIDLNREPYELDPRMFAERLPGHFNTRSPGSPAGSARCPASSPKVRTSIAAAFAFDEALKRIEHIYGPITAPFAPC